MKKKDVPVSTVVSKGWLENAINHHEGVNNSTVSKMDFSETKQVIHLIQCVRFRNITGKLSGSSQSDY